MLMLIFFFFDTVLKGVNVISDLRDNEENLNEAREKDLYIEQ